MSCEVELLRHVKPGAAEHAFEMLQPYNGLTNSWGSRAALLATCDFLRARFAKARCDSDGVSDCVRCQTMFLVGKMSTLLAATAPKVSVSPLLEEEGDA